MTERKDKPLALLLLISLYFLVGFLALTSIFSDTPNFLCLIGLPLAYGLLTAKKWAFHATQALIAIQLIALAFMSLTNLVFSSGHTKIYALGLNVILSPWVACFLFALLIGFQARAIFSAQAKTLWR